MNPVDGIEGAGDVEELAGKFAVVFPNEKDGVLLGWEVPNEKGFLTSSLLSASAEEPNVKVGALVSAVLVVFVFIPNEKAGFVASFLSFSPSTAEGKEGLSESLLSLPFDMPNEKAGFESFLLSFSFSVPALDMKLKAGLEEGFSTLLLSSS